MAGDTAGFESYFRGSWWDVEIKQQRMSMFLVSYTADKDEEWAWVPLTELRLSSRSGDRWDCYILKRGMDVSVLSKHPHSNSLNLQKEGLYDARISSVARSIHAPGQCSCGFSLQFFSVELKTYTGCSLLDRILLTDEPETQVSISDVRILQKPAGIIPLQDILDAHLDRTWIPRGRGCTDAFFVTETELPSTTKRPRDLIGPANVRSPSEVWSPSAARVSVKHGEKGSNCNSPVSEPELEISDPRTAEDGDGDDDFQSNGIVDEGAPKKKRGRPRQGKIPEKTSPRLDQNDYQVGEVASPEKETPDKTTKGITIVPLIGSLRSVMEGAKVCNNPDVTSTPGLNKGLEKTVHKGYAAVEETGDPEWTETVNVSSDEDTISEWKPWPYVKQHMACNLQTRDKCVLRKPKSEREQPITGNDTGPRLLRRATRSSLYGDKYLSSKNTQHQQGSPTFRAPRNAF